ncbi:molecular chaperone GrpE [Raphidiopsis sp. BLCC-F218]
MEITIEQTSQIIFSLLLFLIIYIILRALFPKQPPEPVGTIITISSTEIEQELREKINQKDLEIAELKNQCYRLETEITQQKNQLQQKFQQETFHTLQPLLCTYPTIKSITQIKDLPAKNLIPLLIYLDNLIQSWGYTTIGTVWEQTPYNPQYHQPDSDDIQESEPVYIRFIGYRQNEKIIYPAKVSRTLPET